MSELNALKAISLLLEEIAENVLASDMSDDAKECVTMVCETVDGVIEAHTNLLQLMKAHKNA